MKDKIYKMNEVVIQQEDLSKETKIKLTDYLTEFFEEFDNIMNEDVKLT